MTTTAVLRSEDKIYLGADRRINAADNLKLDSCQKILQLESGEHIAVAGSLVALQAFELFAVDNEIDFSSRLAIYRTMLNYRQDLSVNHLCLTDKHTDSGDFAVMPLLMLIVNNDGVIFSVTNYGEVIEHDKFFAMGSGGDYAMGALYAGATLQAALDAASTFDPHTSPHYDIVEIEIPQLGDNETTYVDADVEDEEDAAS